MKKVDFTVSGGGTIYLLHPNTLKAQVWVNEHLPEDRQTFGNAVAVEHRYIGDVVDGIRSDGLTVN